MTAMRPRDPQVAAAYRPEFWRFVSQHHLAMIATGQRSDVVDGTVLFADVSGFTALSERLERRGREGAELMSNLLAAIFGPMLDVAAERGGDLLGYGGDAVLLLFSGPDHGPQAISAASDMLDVLGRRTPAHRAAGRVQLTMSMGAESGPVALFAAGSALTQLVPLGPTIDEALRAEAAAQGGEVLVGPRLARTIGARGHGENRPSTRELVAAFPSAPIGHDPTTDRLAATALAPPIVRYVTQPDRFGEHRPVTAVFVKHLVAIDVGSASSRQRAADQLDLVTSAILTLCDRHELTLVTPDAIHGGVKFSIVGGAPVAHGDSIDAALSFALDLIAFVGSNAAIGINQGTVYCGEITGSERSVYAVLGDAMNLAARVMSRAEPGEILVESTTASWASVRRNLTAVEPFVAKGKQHLVHAFRVAPGHGGEPDRLESLLGREAELAILDAAHAQAEAGYSGSVGLVAPPGQGKSLLLRTWVESSVDHTRVLSIAGGRLGRLTPFRALSVGLRQHFGLEEMSEAEVLGAVEDLIIERSPAALRWRDLIGFAFGVAQANDPAENTGASSSPNSASVDERLQGERLREALAALLCQPGEPPLIIVVDDAQWLDDATETTLRHLMRNASGTVLTVVAARPGSPTLCDTASEQIELAPLTDEVARRIVRTRSPTPLPLERIGQIVERAAGNPLFLAALAGMRTDSELPGTVEEVIRAELDRFAPATRRVLGELAALGSTADRALVDAVVVGTDSVSLRSLGLASFVRIDDAGMAFVHPLRREVAYEAMPFRDRRAAHRRALDHVLGQADPSKSLVALHAWRSRALPETWQWARLAAREPSARLSPATAVEHLEWAVAASRRLRSVTEVERSGALEELGDAYETLGRFADAERAFRSAISLDRGGARTVARMCRVARQCEHQGDLARGMRWARRARLAASGGDAATRVLPERAETSLRFRAGDLAGALETNDVALHLAVSARDDVMISQTYRMAGTIKELTGEDGIPELRRALDLATRAGDEQGRAWVLNNLGAALYDRGRWRDSAERYRACAESAALIGDSLEAATATNNLAEILSDQGSLREAEVLFLDALEVFAGAGYRIGRAVALGNLGRLHRRAGQLDEADDELAASMEEFAQIGSEDFIVEIRLRRVELELARRDVASANDELSTIWASLDGTKNIGPNIAALHRLTAMVAVAEGDEHNARLGLARARSVADQGGYRYEAALALEAASLMGHLTDAEAGRDLAERFADLGIVESGQRGLVLPGVWSNVQDPL